ncbi:MAG: DNA repair protein RecO [Alicyclobacillus sp.]|nr:DNA repair protein RecO [Alicyclobacillus sp.]
MLYNTEGIVVRTTAYGETHTIVTLLTPSGTVAAMAHGARKPQSRLAAGVQVCTQGIYTIFQRTGMGTLQQLEVVASHRALREHLDLAAYAAYFCELALACAEERPHGHPALYREFAGALAALSAGRHPPALVARMWEAKVLRWLGAAPDWSVCLRCGRSLLQGKEGPCSSSLADPARPAGPSLPPSPDSAVARAYSPRHGGLICAECLVGLGASGEGGERDRSAPVHLVSPRLPNVLHLMARVPWDRLGRLQVSAATARSLSLVLQAQLTDFAGLSLKSRKVLESLGLGDESRADRLPMENGPVEGNS